MREFFGRGGFLRMDDFRGNPAWRPWERQMELVFPGRGIVGPPPDHPLFEIVYTGARTPADPLHPALEAGGRTSERGLESRPPNIRAIPDAGGRIAVLITHDTDIADGWEREAEDPQFLYRFSPDAYAVGVNVAVWMMTH